MVLLFTGLSPKITESSSAPVLPSPLNSVHQQVLLAPLPKKFPTFLYSTSFPLHSCPLVHAPVICHRNNTMTPNQSPVSILTAIWSPHSRQIQHINQIMHVMPLPKASRLTEQNPNSFLPRVPTWSRHCPPHTFSPSLSLALSSGCVGPHDVPSSAVAPMCPEGSSPRTFTWFPHSCHSRLCPVAFSSQGGLSLAILSKMVLCSSSPWLALLFLIAPITTWHYILSVCFLPLPLGWNHHKRDVVFLALYYDLSSKSSSSHIEGTQ